MDYRPAPNRQSKQPQSNQYGHVSYAEKCSRCGEKMFNRRRDCKKRFCLGCEGILRLEGKLSENLDKT